MPSGHGAGVSVGQALPLLQPMDTIDEGGRSGERTWRVPYDPAGASSVWAGLVPAAGTAHPVCPWLRVVADGWSLRPMRRAPLVAELTVRYAAGEWTAEYMPDLPEDETSEDIANMSVDLVRHPRFGDAITGAEATVSATDGGHSMSMSDFYNPREGRIFFRTVVPDEYEDHDGVSKPHPHAGTAVPLSLRGMSRYVVGSGTVRAVAYSYNEPASQLGSGVVGSRGIPPGYSGVGTLANWLIMGVRKASSGGYWAEETLYQYSDREVSAWVYGGS